VGVILRTLIHKNYATTEQRRTQSRNTIGYGVYFLRTSIEQANEQLIWTIYNCIREIESSFRTLKTDLDLRPVYHKSDEGSVAHIHLGVMAYRVVNSNLTYMIYIFFCIFF
jgi:hypothetical protein